MFYAQKIGKIDNSKVVYYMDNYDASCGRYVIIDKDKQDEFIAQNRVMHRKSSILRKSFGVLSILAGVLTYYKSKFGHIGKTLAGAAVVSAGLICDYKIFEAYSSSKSKQLDKKYGVNDINDAVSLHLTEIE